MITDEQWDQAMKDRKCPVCRHNLDGEYPHSDGCPTSESVKRELNADPD